MLYAVYLITWVYTFLVLRHFENKLTYITCPYSPEKSKEIVPIFPLLMNESKHQQTNSSKFLHLRSDMFCQTIQRQNVEDYYFLWQLWKHDRHSYLCILWGLISSSLLHRIVSSMSRGKSISTKKGENCWLAYLIYL